MAKITNSQRQWLDRQKKDPYYKKRPRKNSKNEN